MTDICFSFCPKEKGGRGREGEFKSWGGLNKLSQRGRPQPLQNCISTSASALVFWPFDMPAEGGGTFARIYRSIFIVNGGLVNGWVRL